MTDQPTPTVATTAGTRDLATIIAISIVAFSIANVLHEAVGHGGACVLTGGHARALSTVHFECDHDTRFIAAAGTLVNIITAFLSWIVLRSANRTHHYLRFFLWLLMTINSLGAAGYFLFSGVGNIGDWADVIQGMEPAWLWHVALTLVGAVSYTLLSGTRCSSCAHFSASATGAVAAPKISPSFPISPEALSTPSLDCSIPLV